MRRSGIDGASIGTDSSPAGGWTSRWDTTTVSNGSHTIRATATDSAGQTTTTSVSVLVANDHPPSVALTSRADDAVASGIVPITASASGDRRVTEVEFFVAATRIATDSFGLDGWSASGTQARRPCSRHRRHR